MKIKMDDDWVDTAMAILLFIILLGFFDFGQGPHRTWWYVLQQLGMGNYHITSDVDHNGHTDHSDHH